MKLGSSLGPNPRVVKMFIAEEGSIISIETVDLMAGENRQGPTSPGSVRHRAVALEVEVRVVMAEITAINDRIGPAPSQPLLIGSVRRPCSARDLGCGPGASTWASSGQ